MGPGAVARAIAIARRFADARGLPRDPAERLVLVVEEWVANIVEHGRARPGSLIVVRLAPEAAGVRLEVSDAGIAFDPRTAEDAGPNPERGGGAGMPLIRAWSGIEAYSRRGGRNRLTLRLKS